MGSASYAKFTFFEAATQHGYVVALMAPKLQKSVHKYQIVIDDARGRVFQLFNAANPSVAVWEYVIPDRSTKESTLMWRKRVEQELEASWKAFRTPKGSTPQVESSGSEPTEPSPSEPLSLESSSPGALPVSEISITESEAAATVSPEPAPSPPKKRSSTRKKGSSAGSSTRSSAKA